MRLRIYCLSLLLGVAPAAIAHAQTSVFDRDRNVSVTQRPRPDYDAAGLRAGAFFIYPKVTADVAVEDNIFASETNEQDDVVWSLRPSVEIQSQWSRHSLGARAALNTYRYSDFSSENNTTYKVEGLGRLDILRGTYLRGTVGFEHGVESRQSPSVAQFNSEPIEYDQVYSTVAGSHEFNRLRVSGELRFTDYDYDDTTSVLGAPIDQSYRNRTNYEQVGRLDYAVSPALSIFATASHNSREYNRTTILGDVQRDSDGWEAGIGADFEVTALARGQLQVGYLSQDFDDPRVGTAEGFGLRSRLEWFPTELTTVTLEAERAIDDTGLIGAAGVLATRASVKVDHELLRNLILTARVGASNDDYRGLDRSDDQYSAMLGVNYLLSRKVGLFGSYNYLRRESEGARRGNEFESNRLQLGVVLQY